MPIQGWRIMTPEEEEEYNSHPGVRIQLAYEKRAQSNRRPQCLCGRFAKPGHPPQLNILGEYEFSVICKAHGEVWIS
jgi:hypothetical protein